MDLETFLTTVYVMVDDFVRGQLPKEAAHPGVGPSLGRSEVITLAVLAQWGPFRTERSFYRFAANHLRSAFPTLPDRGQLNRLIRKQADAIGAFALYVADLLDAPSSPYQPVDGMGVRVRNCKRRGHGWLYGRANVGWSNRLGWYEGFYLLIANTREGVITGFGFGPASTNDRQMAETFFAARRFPQPRLPNVGRPATEFYPMDKGFGGQMWEKRWREGYGARAICPPQSNNSHPWPASLRRWLASIRQIAETVHEKLVDVFRLDWERPHALDGFHARLAANIALHNLCMWVNKQMGRPLLAFAGLCNW